MTIPIRTFEFTRAPGDYLVTSAVALDAGGPKFRIVMRWQPQPLSWVLDLFTSSGSTICTGVWVRDRTDCILGVSTVNRPRGGIMSYDPKRRGEPGPDAYTLDGVKLLYVPLGLNPEDFSLYSVPVV
jgi:hypothetical protein